MIPVTEDDVRDANEALSQLPSISQTIALLGQALRRCKPESKRAKAYWAKLTELENKRFDMMDKVRLVIASHHKAPSRTEVKV